MTLKYAQIILLVPTVVSCFYRSFIPSIFQTSGKRKGGTMTLWMYLYFFYSYSILLKYWMSLLVIIHSPEILCYAFVPFVFHTVTKSSWQLCPALKLFLYCNQCIIPFTTDIILFILQNTSCLCYLIVFPLAKWSTPKSIPKHVSFWNIAALGFVQSVNWKVMWTSHQH